MDSTKKSYIIERFTHGFRINYEGDDEAVQSKNSKAALEQTAAVDEKLEKELAAGKIWGPFNKSPLPHFKCCTLSVREKSTPATYRLLHNLSAPYDERAVNYNIPHELKELKNSRSPGSDHLVVEFYFKKLDIKKKLDRYKFLGIDIKQYLINSLKYSLSKGVLSKKRYHHLNTKERKKSVNSSLLQANACQYLCKFLFVWKRSWFGLLDTTWTGSRGSCDCNLSCQQPMRSQIFITDPLPSPIHLRNYCQWLEMAVTICSIERGLCCIDVTCGST